jgi:hypothetical protein
VHGTGFGVLVGAIAWLRVAGRRRSGGSPRGFTTSRQTPIRRSRFGSQIREVRARVATDEERARLWAKFLEFYPGYEFFERNAKGREIPIVILGPR